MDLGAALGSLRNAEQPATANGLLFGMVADIDTQPQAGGTRVVIHRLAAAHAALTVNADTLRTFAATLPPEMHGQIEISLEHLSASGTVDLSIPAGRDHLMSSIAFSGLRMRMTGDPKMTFNVDDLAGAAQVESNLQGVSFERRRQLPIDRSCRPD